MHEVRALSLEQCTSALHALLVQIQLKYTSNMNVCLQIEEEKWYDTTDSNGYKRRRAVTQYHDLIGFSLGTFGKRLAQLCVAISLFGTGIAQIIASSSSQYTISPQINKRYRLVTII